MYEKTEGDKKDGGRNVERAGAGGIARRYEERKENTCRNCRYQS
jgi:hypothetical protein